MSHAANPRALVATLGTILTPSLIDWAKRTATTRLQKAIQYQLRAPTMPTRRKYYSGRMSKSRKRRAYSRRPVYKRRRLMGRRRYKRFGGYKGGYSGKVARRALGGLVNNVIKCQHPFPVGLGAIYEHGALYWEDLLWPQIDTLNADITRRETNTIYVRGLKIHRVFDYRGSKEDANFDIGPIRVHWALVQYRNDSTDATITSQLATDFIRDNSKTTDRTADFAPYSSSDSWKWYKTYGQINPNKNIRVLTHKSKILHPYYDKSGCDNQAMGHRWVISRYYKVGRFFNFDNTSATDPNKRIFEVFWYNCESAARFPAGPTPPSNQSAVRSHRCNTVYFSNQK